MSVPARPLNELSSQERALRELVATPLTPELFAPFGDVIHASGPPDQIINRGRCGRYNDVARLDFDDAGPILSLHLAECRSSPYQLNSVRRNNDNSETYIPLSGQSFLAIVCEDFSGRPGPPTVFITRPGMGVNYNRGVWFGNLTPVAANGVFAVFEGGAEFQDTEEHWFELPYFVTF